MGGLAVVSFEEGDLQFLDAIYGKGQVVGLGAVECGADLRGDTRVDALVAEGHLEGGALEDVEVVERIVSRDYDWQGLEFLDAKDHLRSHVFTAWFSGNDVENERASMSGVLSHELRKVDVDLRLRSQIEEAVAFLVDSDEQLIDESSGDAQEGVVDGL